MPAVIKGTTQMQYWYCDPNRSSRFTFRESGCEAALTPNIVEEQRGLYSQGNQTSWCRD